MASLVQRKVGGTEFLLASVHKNVTFGLWNIHLSKSFSSQTLILYCVTSVGLIIGFFFTQYKNKDEWFKEEKLQSLLFFQDFKDP